MDKHERRQRERIVGWWLGTSAAELVSGSRLDDQFQTVVDLFNQVVERGERARLAPDKVSDYNLKQRVWRFERALAGVAISTIARQEGIGSTTVNDSIKYTLARLAIIAREIHEK